MRQAKDLPRDGDQLRLDLFKDVPWDGVSPRVFTRGFEALFLRPEPPHHEVYQDPMQLQIWSAEQPHREKSPHGLSVGAPSLLPFLKHREVRNG